MSREKADALIRNLKLFNAKERDHLMRFAYLDESEPYKAESKFLAPKFSGALDEHVVRDTRWSGDAKCVFAGMDYHLDWLFAALWMANHDPSWSPPRARPCVPMEPHTANGFGRAYTDFRPLTGSQEDIDLLAVFEHGDKLTVLLVEAKGVSSFNTVQLARKIIRINRIRAKSGGSPGDEPWIEFRLILAAPARPRFTCCIGYAKNLGEDPKFVPMREELGSLGPDAIGSGLHFIKIGGFPKTYAVERVRTGGAFTDWTLKERKWKKHA